jgi:uncharacterized membrane protein YeaQ/YmgE (transglycosylase-associated protein family)
LNKRQASLAHQTPSQDTFAAETAEFTLAAFNLRRSKQEKETKIMEPMSLLAWIVVGLIAGWLASQVVASRFGVIGDTIVGMLGALVGGFLFEQLGSTGTTGFSIWSIVVSFVGAVVLLILLRALSGQRMVSA